MNKFQAAILSYGVILILGGIYAYLDKHHLPSLMGGLTLGVISIFFAALSKTNPRVGFIGAAVTALLGAFAFMGAAMAQSSKGESPAFAIFMIVLSIVMVAFLLGGHFMARRKARSTQGSVDPSA